MKHKNGGNMSTSVIGNNYFGTERIGKILLRIAPPVMLAQLIQSLYNIVDSFFVGKYSDNALTALTVVYPLQLIIVALAVVVNRDFQFVCFHFVPHFLNVKTIYSLVL